MQLYDFIDSIVIDKDDIHINFDFPDTDSKGASDPFAYVIANNLLEISKMFFELGYKPECTFKAQRNEEFDCFGILAYSKLRTYAKFATRQQRFWATY